eukprot:jgi/Psemu1/311108/fgenesh1_kg.721_\
MEPTTTATVTGVRDVDELEGALLPVATEVVEGGPGNETIPTTTQVFDYDAAFSLERQQREQEEFGEAIAIPDNGNRLNYAGVSDDSKTTVSKAEQTGRIRSEEELEYIRKNRSKILPRDYHEANSFKSANARAKQRNKEGLQVQSDHLEAFTERLLPEKLKVKEQNAAKMETPVKKGYQVNEYNCMTYDTSEYEVTEYKSIYE